MLNDKPVYFLHTCKAEQNDDKAGWEAMRKSSKAFEQSVVDYRNRFGTTPKLVEVLKLLQKPMPEMGIAFTAQKVRLTLQKFNLAPHYIDSIINALENE